MLYKCVLYVELVVNNKINSKKTKFQKTSKHNSNLKRFSYGLNCFWDIWLTYNTCFDNVCGLETYSSYKTRCQRKNMRISGRSEIEPQIPYPHSAPPLGKEGVERTKTCIHLCALETNLLCVIRIVNVWHGCFVGNCEASIPHVYHTYIHSYICIYVSMFICINMCI